MARKYKRLSKAKTAQYKCPILRCPNRSAPNFGMVCATHKDLPRRVIKAARKARAEAKRN
jgi:hypothetical protein